MDISKRQKLFGVGPVGAFISFVLLAIAVWVNHALGHPAILANPAPIKVIGVVFVVIGLGLHFWSMWTLQNWWGKDELCTMGPFKWFRHPMYAAWITFILPAAALYSNSWIILFFVILLHPIWHMLVIREEKMMFEKFHDEYRAYAARTGRFPPDMGSSILMKAFIVFFILLTACQAYAVPAEHVVLLHGLARTSNSMNKLAKHLSGQGYRVVNIDYPSRRYALSELAKLVRKDAISKTTGADKIHFVTHSMGGIIVRYIQKHDSLPNLGRVVMLSPPNRGSEVVDFLDGIWLFESINGPVGKQLGTGENSICRILGKVNFELGIITGDRSINWINSFIIPEKDDGKGINRKRKSRGYG